MVTLFSTLSLIYTIDYQSETYKNNIVQHIKISELKVVFEFALKPIACKYFKILLTCLHYC